MREQMGHDNLRRGTGEPRRTMMLRNPVTLVTQRFRTLREPDGKTQRVVGIRSVGNRTFVENRKGIGHIDTSPRHKTRAGTELRETCRATSACSIIAIAGRYRSSKFCYAYDELRQNV
jgi:hypothetical protein